MLNFKDIYEKKKEAMQNKFDNVDHKEFFEHLRRNRYQRNIRIMHLPQEPMSSEFLFERLKHFGIFQELVQDDVVDCRIEFKGREGSGKSNCIKNKFNLKKVLELGGLALLYQALFGVLLFIIGIIGFIP